MARAIARPRTPAATSAWMAAPVSSTSLAPAPPAGRAAKPKPAVGLLLGHQPARGRAHLAGARGQPRGAQGEDAERRDVREVLEGAVAALVGEQPRRGVAARQRVDRGAAGAQREDRALEVARALQRAGPRAQRVEHRVAVAAQLPRLVPGGGEADRRPGRVQLAAGLPGRAAEAAVGVLGALEIPARPGGCPGGAWRPTRRAAAAASARDTGAAERGHDRDRHQHARRSPVRSR